jgi:hypothetical protein
VDTEDTDAPLHAFRRVIRVFLKQLSRSGCPFDCPGTTCDPYRHEATRFAKMALDGRWTDLGSELAAHRVFSECGAIPERATYQGVVSDSPLMDAKGTGGLTLRTFLRDALSQPVAPVDLTPRGVVVGVVSRIGNRFLDYFSSPTRDRPDMQWEDLQWFGGSLQALAGHGMLKRLEDQAEKLGYDLVKKGGEK